MPNEVGQFIRSKRKEANMTLKQVSEGAGISFPYLSTLETGKRDNPSAEVLNKIANVLSIPSVEILTIGGYLAPVKEETLGSKENGEWKLNQLSPLEILMFLTPEVVRNIFKSYVEKAGLKVEEYELLDAGEEFLRKITTKEYLDLMIVKHKDLLHIYVFLVAIVENTGIHKSPETIWKWYENLNEKTYLIEKELDFDAFGLWYKHYFSNDFLSEYGDYKLTKGRESSFDLSALIECETFLFDGKILSPTVERLIRNLLESL